MLFTSVLRSNQAITAPNGVSETASPRHAATQPALSCCEGALGAPRYVSRGFPSRGRTEAGAVAPLCSGCCTPAFPRPAQHRLIRRGRGALPGPLPGTTARQGLLRRPECEWHLLPSDSLFHSSFLPEEESSAARRAVHAGLMMPATFILGKGSACLLQARLFTTPFPPVLESFTYTNVSLGSSLLSTARCSSCCY